jgi:hypothetical protein
MSIIRTARSSLAAATLAALAFAAPAALLSPAVAHETQRGPVIEGTALTISAEGSVAATPDMATVSLGVTTEGATADAALRANAERMDRLVQVLRRAGIAERDIQTSGLNVNPQYVYVENRPPTISGYMALNQVSVRVRNLDGLGRIVDQAIAAGGNTLNGISFGLQDRDAALNAARRDAMADALARINLYAEAAGLRLHRIISISEGGGYMPAPPMPYAMARMEDAMAAPTPIAPGEVETRISLSLVVELR